MARIRITTVLLALAACHSAVAGSDRSALVLGQEFHGLSSDFQFAQSELQADISCIAGSQESRAEAPLALPDEARINAWQVWFSDATPEGDLEFDLIRRCRNPATPGTVEFTVLGHLATSGVPGDAIEAQTLDEPIVVDATSCTYAIRAEFDPENSGCSGGNRRIYQARVDYTSDAARVIRSTSSLDGTALRREQHASEFTTTADAELLCRSTSSGAYFITRMPLPDKAVPLAAHAWFVDDDSIWAATAAFRVLCRGDSGQTSFQNLAVLSTQQLVAPGAVLQSAVIDDPIVVDQRECSVVVINSATVGDPCVSEALRYGRMSLEYVIDPVFASEFDSQTSPSRTSL